MRSRPRAAMLLALAFATAACELVWRYDDFGDQPGTGGSAPSSSSSSSGGGSTASSGGGSMASSGGGSTASSGGGSMASSGGGSMASSGGGATASSSSSSSSGCALDDDLDQSLSWTCHPADSTLDCADEDARAFPGAGFEASPIMGPTRPGTQPWDFDCDGVVVQETPILHCGGFVFCAGESGYEPGTAPECGMAYTLGHCLNNGALLACQWNADNPIVTRVQRCK